MHAVRFHRRAIRAAALLSCLAALSAPVLLPAHAADVPRKAPAKAKPKSLLLSRDELRACMNAKSGLDQQNNELAQQQAQLTAEKAELLRLGDELKDRLSTLDRTNRELVEQYVEASNAREKRIDAFEASGKVYDQKVQALESARESYEKDCAHKRFDAADEMAIKAGK